MKKHNRPTFKGLRRRSRQFTKSFSPRIEQLEERALLAADVEYRLVATTNGNLPPDTPVLVGDPPNPATRFSGFAIPSLSVSGNISPNTFTLSVYAQDARTSPPQPQTVSANDPHGFTQAFLDVSFNTGLLGLPIGAQASSFTPGARFTPDDGSLYPEKPHDVVQGSVATPGLLDEVGVFVDFTDLLSQQSGQSVREMLMFRAPFQVKGAPLGGLADNFSVNEDSPSITLDVLVNDTVGGIVTLNGSTASTTTQFIVSDQFGNSAASSFNFTNAAINIIGTKGITLLSSTSNQGGAISLDSNNRVVYKPAGNFSGTDTFSYQLFNADDPSASKARQTITVSVVVNPQNDPPTVGTSAGIVSYVEHGAAVTIDPNVVVADFDNVNLSAAQVKIATGFVAGDQLAFTNQNGISGNYNAGTGVLTLGGSSSVANYQAALRSVAYFTTSENPTAVNRVVQFTVNDGVSNSIAVAAKTVAVATVNDGPRFTISSPQINYTEAGTVSLSDFTAVDATLTFNDPEGNNITGATVTIGNYVSGQDVLRVSSTPASPLSATFSATGVLTITGTASAAAYQAVLRTVQYRNTSENPTAGPRPITFRATDNGSPAIAGSGVRTINVVPTNEPPVLKTASTSAAVYTEQAAPLIVDSRFTLTDLDNTTLQGATVQISTGFQTNLDQLTFTPQAGINGAYNAVAGTLTLTNADPNAPATLAAYLAVINSVRFSSASDNPGISRSIAYTVNDGSPANGTATLVRSLTVKPVNDAPSLGTTSTTNAAYTEQQPLAVVVDPNLTLSDVDGTTLKSATVKITTGFQSGKDQLTFTPQSRIAVNTATAGTLILSSASSTNPASLDEFLALLRSVKFSTTSAAPGPLRTIAITAVDNVSPNPSVTLNRTINITEVNSAPVLGSTSAVPTYTENGAAVPVVVNSNLTLTDGDNTTLANATVQITGGFQPGTDILTFSAQSGLMASYSSATGVLTVAKSSPTSTATLSTYLTLLKSVKFNSTSDDPGTFRTLTFTVNDGSATNATATLERTVIVKPVNDVPKFVSASPIPTFTEKGPPIVVDGAVNLTDLDNAQFPSATAKITTGFISAQDRLAFTPVGNVTGNYDIASGTLFLTGPASPADFQATLRTVTYVNLSSNPSTTTRVVTFSANDGAANTPFARSVKVVAVNDAPTINTPADLTLNQNSPRQTISLGGITAGGGEAQPLKVTATSSNTALIPNPTITYTSPGAIGSLAFTPAVNRPAGNVPETAIITIRVEDGGLDNSLTSTTGIGANGVITKTFTVTVNPANIAPTATVDSFLLANDAGPQSLAPLANDSPGPSFEAAQQLTLISVTLATGAPGSVVLNPDGKTFTYTPVPGGSYDAAFTYVVRDSGTPAKSTTGLGGVIQVRPTSGFSGFVYIDADELGTKDAGETGIGGVTVTLKKAGDASFSRVATTNASGFYEFTGLLPGSYTVEESQPVFLADGQESAENAAVSSPTSDKFVFDIPNSGGLNLANNNFGELASALGLSNQGLSMAVVNGITQWYAFGGGWAGFSSASATLDSQTVNLQVVDAANAALAASIALPDSRVAVSGDENAGLVFDFNSSAGDYGLTAVAAGEGEFAPLPIAAVQTQSVGDSLLDDDAEPTDQVAAGRGEADEYAAAVDALLAGDWGHLA